jgi:type III secretion system YscD/HrpQ family protein
MPNHLMAKEGPLQGLVLDLSEGDKWLVGRDPDLCDMVLPDRTVSRKHCLIQRVDDGITIEDLSHTNPIFINDQAIAEAYLLKEGDIIKIGDNNFIFSEEDIPQLEQEEEKDDDTEIDANVEMDEEEYHTVFSEGEKIPEEEEEEEIDKPEAPPAEALEEEDKSYDTIFEDMGDDLSYDMIQESPFILKVISGPNAGAEFAMDKNRGYIIGKDPNTCDIVFNDLSVSRNHAKITIDDEGIITIEDLHSRNNTLINGLSIDDTTHITPQDLIALGTTTFLIIDKNTETETIYSPFPSYEPHKETEEEEEHVVIDEEAEKAKQLSWKEQVIPKQHLFLAGSFIVVLFVVVISFFSLFKGQKVEVYNKDETKSIQTIVDKYSGVEFSFNPRGENLFLVGHLLTTIEHEELMYSINQLPYIKNINDNIIIDELVWKSINDVLNDNENWRGISMHSPEAGKFLLNGYVSTSQDYESLTEYINVHFSYVDRLENNVIIIEVIKAKIESVILSKGFDGLGFQFNNGDLIVTGRYNNIKKESYKKMLEELNALPGVTAISNVAIASTEESSRIDLTNKFKITGYAKHGHNNFSVVANGQIVSLGSLLDGMAITAIQPHAILLEKEGIKYKIDYNQ